MTTLIVVSGPPGSGKTTLAHALARELGCPAICRDEIREGVVRAGTDDPGLLHTFTTFFEVLTLLAGAGVTTVAEAAFQDKLWRPALTPLASLAALRIVRCTVEPALARDRIAQRLATEPNRAAHNDAALLQAMEAGTAPPWEPIALDVPTVVVDTSDGYSPALADVVEFVLS